MSEENKYRSKTLIAALLIFDGIKWLALNSPTAAKWLVTEFPGFTKRAAYETAPHIKSYALKVWAERISWQQLKTFYKAADYAQAALHLALGAGLVGLAGAWAGTVSLISSAGIAGVLTLGASIGFESFLPKLFKRRAFDTAGLPYLLRKSIESLTRKAGLRQVPEVYDFALDKEKVADHTDVTTAPAQMQRVMNAAAVSLTKPALLVSEPLIEALKPSEMKAVLAHEFTHLGAKHSWTHMLSGWLQTTTMFTAFAGFGHAVLEQGWTSTFLSIGGVIAVSEIGNKFLPKKEERVTKDGTVKPRTRRTQMAILSAQEALTLGILAIPAPVTVLTAAAIEHGFFWSANLVNKSLSRRMEFQADRGAATLGANPLSLVTSLRKLTANLQENEPELAESMDVRTGSMPMKALKHVEALFRTHPDTQRRCWELAKIAATKGSSQGEISEALNGEIVLPRPAMQAMKENPTAGLHL